MVYMLLNHHLGNKSWVTVDQDIPPPSRLKMVLEPFKNDLLLIYGGQRYSADHPIGILGDLVLFNTTSNSWSSVAVPDDISGRYSAASSLDYHGDLYIFGGCVVVDNDDVKCTESFELFRLSRRM